MTQVNVGAGVTIPVPAPLHGVPLPHSPVALPPPLGAAPGAVTAQIGSLLEATPFVDITDITAALDPGETAGGSTELASATPFTAPGAPTTGPTPRPSSLHARSGGLRARRIPTTPAVRTTPTSTSAVDAAWRSVSPTSPVGLESPARPPQARPSPRAPGRPSNAPVISVSGVSAGAAAGGSGGSSGSGLPLLLALPFVAALLDLARRVALEHATWPSGHRRRVPDRPG